MAIQEIRKDSPRPDSVNVVIPSVAAENIIRKLEPLTTRDETRWFMRPFKSYEKGEMEKQRKASNLSVTLRGALPQEEKEVRDVVATVTESDVNFLLDVYNTQEEQLAPDDPLWDLVRGYRKQAPATKVTLR